MLKSVRLGLVRKNEQIELEVWVQSSRRPSALAAGGRANAIAPVLLQELVVQLNAKTIVSAHLGDALADNAKFVFVVSAVQGGDQFLVTCTDSGGGMVEAKLVVPA